MFISEFKTVYHFSPSSAKLIQSTLFPSYIFKIHFNIILPSMPRSFKWSLSFRFPPPNPQNHVHISHFSHTSHMPRTHHLLLNLTTQIMSGEDYNRWSSSLCNLLQSPPTSSNLGPTYSVPYSWTAVNKHTGNNTSFKYHSNYNTPSDLILKNLAFCAQSLFMCTLWLSQ